MRLGGLVHGGGDAHRGGLLAMADHSQAASGAALSAGDGLGVELHGAEATRAVLGGPVGDESARFVRGGAAGAARTVREAARYLAAVHRRDDRDGALQ